jgi:hypothetical protein
MEENVKMSMYGAEFLKHPERLAINGVVPDFQVSLTFPFLCLIVVSSVKMATCSFPHQMERKLWSKLIALKRMLEPIGFICFLQKSYQKNFHGSAPQGLPLGPLGLDARATSIHGLSCQP